MTAARQLGWFLRWSGRWGAALLAACMGLFLAVSSVRASEGRPADWTVDLATRSMKLGRVELRYEPHLDEGAAYLAERVPVWWSDIEQTLATDLDDTLVITYVDHAGRVAEATGMPRWVAGVAHPSSGEILIARHGPDGAPVDLKALVRHEMAHVALYRATGGAAVPRWFSEGVAESLEDNVDLLRAQTLATIVFGSGVPSLEQLERSFRAADRHDASSGYAVARDLASYLRFHDGTGTELRQLLTELRLGYGFDAAFVRAYGVGLGELVKTWRDGLPARFFWFPLLAGGGVPMAIVMPLLFAAWIRNRRKRKAGWARLEREDADLFASLRPGAHGSTIVPAQA